MQCEACGIAAPTRHVTFHQNVGLLILRFPSSVKGHLCGGCIDQYFWRMSVISLLFGWWGVISFFYTLVTLPMNVLTYLGAASLGRSER